MAQSSDSGFGRVLRNGNGNGKQDLNKKPMKAGTKEATVSAGSAGMSPSSTAAAKQRAPRTSAPRAPAGVVMSRRYTTAGTDPLDEVVYERRSSMITNPDGSIVFKMEGAEIPASWSQLATDIVISKYFRKAGLHGDKH